MPLNYSCSEKAVSDNIAREMKRGWTQAQAVAIAMSTLTKGCRLTPAQQKKARGQRWTAKEIIAAGRRARQNPFPLIIAGLSNPQSMNEFSKSDIEYADKKWRGMYGENAKMDRLIADIPGVEDGSVGIVRGAPIAIEYRFSNVKNSVKPKDVFRHEEGDTGSERIKPAKGVIVDIVKNGKIQTTVIVRNKNVVDSEGYYIS